MTTLTMKSTFNSSHMGKTFHQAKYGSGGHPQWMRTLEEKYQKLHKKITENTNLIPLPHSHGRTVYDVRLAGMVSKYREKTSFVNSNNRRPSTLHSTSRTPSAVKYRNSSAHAETKRNTQSKLNKTGDAEVIQNKNLDSKYEGIENKDDCNNAETQIIKNNDEIWQIYNLSINKDDSSPDKVVEDASNITDDLKRPYSGQSLKEEKENKNPVQEVQEVQEVKGNENHEDSDIKMSTRSTSRITAKSCSAEIQTTSSLSKRPLSRTKLRSKSAHKTCNAYTENGVDVFTSMSKEAQFAVTETIQEMNLMRSKTVIISPNPTGQDNDLQQLGRLPFETHFSETRKLYNNDILLSEKETDCKRIDDRDEIASCECSNETKEISERHPSGGLNGHRKLPNIQTETGQFENSARHSGFTSQQYRIPGIGKYDVPTKRDNLFEITPPGFDIRYRDAMPFEERESETPPLIIRERAIQKCNEWLSKYAPI